MSSRLALIALMTLSLAACEGTGLPGLDSQKEPVVEGHKGPPDVSPLQAPIETGGEARPVSTAEASTFNTAAFSARGNEPFWSVDASGSTALYKTPENQKGRAVRVNRLAFAEGVEYIGVLNGRPFVLNIRGTACEDDMSGEKFPMTATLTVSGRSNKGCAAPASAEVAAAVAAIKAPAPATPKPARTVTPKPAATRPAASPAPAATSTETPVETPAVTEPAPATAAPTEAKPAEAKPVEVKPLEAKPAETTPVPDAAAPSVPAPVMQLPATPPSVTTEPVAPAAADAESGE